MGIHNDPEERSYELAPSADSSHRWPYAHARGSPAHQPEWVVAPSELILQRLERYNRSVGHENAGFLSLRRGYLPREAPLLRLDPRFTAWDELAAQLPALHRDLSLRRRVEELPLLDASRSSLPDREVLRAASLLAILSHAYWYVDSRPPADLPEVLRKPWSQVRKRLGRRQEVISYLDLIIYNWKLRDPKRPLTLENVDLLFPTIGNEEERVFYLTQLEILSQTEGLLALVGAAQSASLRRDDETVERALLEIADCLARVVGSSLPKISPHAYSQTYVDPVVWAKTVAPFAVPIHRGDQGPSGTSSPIFNTLDIFFGRKDFRSFLGREIKQLRSSYPCAWRVYLEALSEVSVARYVEQRGSRPLRAAWHEATSMYVGPSGFLGRHRMKVYGFLELAFKVGRSVTIGGFGGVFTDRTWDQVDDELRRSQGERTRGLLDLVHHGRVVNVSDPPACADQSGIRRVTLALPECGARYRGGDRCLILPENDPRVVERTVAALDARGDELVVLTDEWRAHATDRRELAGKLAVPLRDVLRCGAIRPVSPRLAEALHARTQAPLLFDAIVRGCTERWELWELLELLSERGFAPSTLWRDPAGAVGDGLTRLIPPQRFRVYSVSSAGPSRYAGRLIELTVGQLRYRSPEPASCSHAQGSAEREAEVRHGTASNYLIRVRTQGREVPLRLERPELFRVPADPSTPIVMFAGGSGVAPFRAFLEERARQPNAGAAWLFLSVRSPEDFLYVEDLKLAVQRGRLALELGCTRVGAQLHHDANGELRVSEGPKRRIDELMLAPESAAQLYDLARRSEDEGGAHFYVCGRSGFADTVLGALRTIFARAERDDDRRAWERLYGLVGTRRLLLELHSDTQPVEEQPRMFDLSEVAVHNDARQGYWLVIDRVVYDLTAFLDLHPGGRRVIQTYAGMDATHGFARAHHARPDVDAMRESYRIGMLRTPNFDEHTVTVHTASGDVTVDCSGAYRAFAKSVQLVVEMQNALSADQSLRLDREAASDGERSAYELLRALETHRRFLQSYFRPLSSEHLPELWTIAQGLLLPSEDPAWMPAFVAEQRASEEAHRAEALAAHAFEAFETLAADGTREQLATWFAEIDRWFLARIKVALLHALRTFERHGPAVREVGATEVRRACLAAAKIVRAYYRRASRAERMAQRPVPPKPSAPSNMAERGAARRLHTGAYWTLEEFPEQRLAVLKRTPLPLRSLHELTQENERVLAALEPRHQSYGLVVDTRNARLRNDRPFEDAMARLRHELTRHFDRTAVLLESSIGELQVSRIERDERRDAIATRSESTAYRFAQGGQ